MGFRTIRPCRVIPLALIALSLACSPDGGDAPPAGQAPPGMVWVPGGEYRMGSESAIAWPAEAPAHRVRVSGFWMDVTEVTNDQFGVFVEATGYVTTAEREIDLDELMQQVPPGTPPVPEEMLQPGSLVFVGTDGPVPLNDASQWTQFVYGADWRHPEGPDSSIANRGGHPVVQVSWDDAAAYAAWAGKRLPTEVEWELAARGGLDGKPYAWGEGPLDMQSPQANTWNGSFPHENTGQDGWVRTAPVGSFEPNGYGLHDMAGNVWEWCDDWYRADHHRAQSDASEGEGPAQPLSPKSYWNPNMPFEKQRVIKGGSFLCHESYCASYRPSARLGTSYDTGSSHVGFRCVSSAPPPQG